MALVAASVLVCVPVFPVGATDAVPIVGSEVLIGKLMPVTGDPVESRSLDLRIEFPHDSAEINERAEIQLRELGAALTSVALRQAELAVYGHTDSSGSAGYNQELSERRATAVAIFLQLHFAIGEERLREVRGYGESQPREDLAPSATAQRRVEVVAFYERPPESTEASEEAPAPAVEEPAQVLPLSGVDTVVRQIAGESAAKQPAPYGEEEATAGGDGYTVIE